MVRLRDSPPSGPRFESLPNPFSEIPENAEYANAVMRRYLDYIAHERRNAPKDEVIEVKDDLTEFLENDYEKQLN